VLEVVGGGHLEVEIAGAAFDPTHVGMYLELAGADDPLADGTYPIVAYLSATRVRIALSALGADSGWSVAGSYAVLGGAGPTPSNVAFLDPTTALTIDKMPTAESSGFSTLIQPGGSGLALDDATTALDAVPTDGTAASFSCAGAGGNCGVAQGTLVYGRTTNAPVAGLPDSAMPPSTTGSVAEWHCQSFSDDVEIPAEAMSAILATGPTRIETRVLRANVGFSGDGSGLYNWVFFAGHGLVGYTTVASSAR
jgi:hypothetical protein